MAVFRILSTFLLLCIVPLAYASEAPSPVTREEAIHAIFQTFQPQNAGMYSAGSFEDVSPQLRERLGYFCHIQAISCTNSVFSPAEPMSTAGFLKVLLTTLESTQGLRYSIPEEISSWHAPYTEGAKRAGLISPKTDLGTLSQDEMQKILSKYQTIASYGFFPEKFFRGLTTTPDVLTAQDLGTLADVKVARSHYNALYTKLLQRITTTQDLDEKLRASKVLAMTMNGQRRLNSIELDMQASPLLYDIAYSDEDRQLFAEHGIREVIGEGYYDFRTNPGYRKHNIRNSIDNAHRLVLQPGEDFDYWDVMWNRGGLRDIGYGWIIEYGKEKWAWGGGLCGTATALFRGAWFGGLEILERRNHSNYYSGLYDGKLIGFDAAVYNSSPNLRFRNNTGAPVMIYIKWNATRDEVWVQILGTKHFASLDAPMKATRGGGYYTIQRTFTYGDGSTTTDTQRSSYRKIY